MAKTAKPKSSNSTPANDDVHAFWEGMAETHGSSNLATAPDHHYRTLEIESILRVLGGMENESILDVGCGNGYTTRHIAKAFPASEIIGVDYSAKMIEEANKSPPANTSFYEGDVLSLSRHPELGGKFDVVISTRCLINLSNWEEQKVAILEMRRKLKPGGHLILVENVQEGLDNLNQLRAGFGLDPIKVRWHNKYLPQTELAKFLAGLHGHTMTTEYTENIGNMYYVASRVIYASLCKQQGVEPDYNNPINEIASKLPSMGEFYACSPNFLILIKNEADDAQPRA